MSKYNQVAEILRNAKSDIAKLLNAPEDETLLLQSSVGLDSMANRLLLLSGAGDIKPPENPKLGPATTMGGKPIKRHVNLRNTDLYPTDEKLNNLRQNVETAYKALPTMSPGEALTTFENTILRGVAKKLKMPVTKDEPKVLTPEFVDEMRDKIAAAEGIDLPEWANMGAGHVDTDADQQEFTGQEPDEFDEHGAPITAAAKKAGKKK